MRKWTIVAGALASAILVGGRAEAANCANVTFTSPSIPTWNPINPAAVQASFTATIARTSSSSRSARLILIDTNNASAPVRVGSAGPQYQITNTGTGATISFPQNTSVTAQTVATTDLPNGSGGNSVNVNLQVTIPANIAAEDFVGGATFSETLNYGIQCFNNSNNPNGTDSPVASNLTLSMTIPKLVSITTGSPATINFGSFTTATQSLNVGLKSTSSVNVSVATTNVNQMVLAGAVAPYPSNSVIPYTMTLNGDTVANGTSLTNRPRATVAGTNWPLVLTLTGGVPSGKLAGSYSDTITLTLTPGT
jgi:hypothetical protein